MSDEHPAIAALDEERFLRWKRLLSVKHSMWVGDLVSAKVQVKKFGHNWADLPFDNGSDVYTCSLDRLLLIRGLLLFRVLVRDVGWSLAEIQHEVGLQGGGQWRVFPGKGRELLLDRFVSGDSVLERLLARFNDLKREGRVQVGVEPALAEEWALLQTREQDFDRYWTGYRWFGNDRGEIPRPKPILQDYPSRSLLEFKQ